jgi:hypothetical protein
MEKINTDTINTAAVVDSEVISQGIRSQISNKSPKKQEKVLDSVVSNANEHICKVLDDLKTFLCKKNISYAGSVFKEIVYGGKVIAPIDAVNIRITDKIRRLTGGGKGYVGEPDEQDLLGYLVIKLALTAIAEKKKQNDKQRRKTRKQGV